MLVLRVGGWGGGGPDLGQPTLRQSIPYQFKVWGRKEGGLMVRRRQPTLRQSKAVLIDVLMPKGGGGNPSMEPKYGAQGSHFKNDFHARQLEI